MTDCKNGNPVCYSLLQDCSHLHGTHKKRRKKICERYSVKKKKKKKDVFILSKLDMYMFLLKHTPSHMQRLLFSSNDKAAHYHIA